MGQTVPWLHDRLRSVVTLYAHTLDRTGTGFVVAEGHVLTAAHCVVDDSGVRSGGTHKPETDITVAFHDGRTTRVDLVGFDMHADVAVLRLPAHVACPSPTPVRCHTYPMPGDPCVVIGNIVGQDPRSVAVGTVRNGRWKDPDGLSLLSTVLTDVATGSGTSGGPILDAAGHVVALHTAAYGAAPRSDDTAAGGVTTQLGGGVASPMLWRIYGALVEGMGPRAKHALPCDTRPTSDGARVVSAPDGGPFRVGDLVQSVGAVQIGGGRDRASVHDTTWLGGPLTYAVVVVDRLGTSRTLRVQSVPVGREVAVGYVQSWWNDRFGYLSVKPSTYTISGGDYSKIELSDSAESIRTVTTNNTRFVYMDYKQQLVLKAYLPNNNTCDEFELSLVTTYATLSTTGTHRRGFPLNVAENFMWSSWLGYPWLLFAYYVMVLYEEDEQADGAWIFRAMTDSTGDNEPYTLLVNDDSAGTITLKRQATLEYRHVSNDATTTITIWVRRSGIWHANVDFEISQTVQDLFGDDRLLYHILTLLTRDKARVVGLYTDPAQLRYNISSIYDIRGPYTTVVEADAFTIDDPRSFLIDTTTLIVLSFSVEVGGELVLSNAGNHTEVRMWQSVLNSYSLDVPGRYSFEGPDVNLKITGSLFCIVVPYLYTTVVMSGTFKIDAPHSFLIDFTTLGYAGMLRFEVGETGGDLVLSNGGNDVEACMSPKLQNSHYTSLDVPGRYSFEGPDVYLKITGRLVCRVVPNRAE